MKWYQRAFYWWTTLRFGIRREHIEKWANGLLKYTSWKLVDRENTDV